MVVDGAGKPWPGVKVGRGWAFGSPQTMEDGYTGPNGAVTFDRRIQSHSVLGRCRAALLDVLVVHGDVHINDQYLVSFPDGYTAEIDSDAPFKWVDDHYHAAQVDFRESPRDTDYRMKFTFKRIDSP